MYKNDFTVPQVEKLISFESVQPLNISAVAGPYPYTRSFVVSPGGGECEIFAELAENKLIRFKRIIVSLSANRTTNGNNAMVDNWFTEFEFFGVDGSSVTQSKPNPNSLFLLNFKLQNSLTLRPNKNQQVINTDFLFQMIKLNYIQVDLIFTENNTVTTYYLNTKISLFYEDV